MTAIRVVAGETEFTTQQIERPILRPGTARVKINAAFLPPYMAGLPVGGWMTPQRPFTPGQCAIGTILETTEEAARFPVGSQVYCDMYIEANDDERSHAFIGCFGLSPSSEKLLRQWPNGTLLTSLSAQCTALPQYQKAFMSLRQFSVGWGGLRPLWRPSEMVG